MTVSRIAGPWRRRDRPCIRASSGVAGAGIGSLPRQFLTLPRVAAGASGSRQTAASRVRLSCRHVDCSRRSPGGSFRNSAF
jgi:hypothetical protein